MGARKVKKLSPEFYKWWYEQGFVELLRVIYDRIASDEAAFLFGTPGGTAPTGTIRVKPRRKRGRA